MSTVSSTSSSSNTWDKTVSDINDVDESLANARDLGYTRLNYARVSAVASLDYYNTVDTYTISVQSSGYLTISLVNGEGEEESLLDLSEYTTFIDDMNSDLGLNEDSTMDDLDAALDELTSASVVETTAPGMSLQVYMTINNKEVLIADSTADQDSEEYQNMVALMSGTYKAEAGQYYICVGTSETITDDDESFPYILQIQQGDSYKHDYVTTQSYSSDSTNKTITETPDETLSGSTSSSYYATLLQASSNTYAASILSDGYIAIASRNDDSSYSSILFDCLL